MQIKIMRYQYLPVKMDKMQNTAKPKCWQEYVVIGILIYCWRKYKMIHSS